MGDVREPNLNNADELYRNIILNQPERPGVRGANNENPAREIELAPINPRDHQDDIQNNPEQPERPGVRGVNNENPIINNLRNVLPADPRHRDNDNRNNANFLAELERAADEDRIAEDARNRAIEDEANRRGCCRGR